MTDLAVIMSVYYNDKIDFLKQSVQSILTQTYTDFDFYIVFDGPVVYSVEKYISNLTDSRIKLYRLANNEGLAKAMNYLLAIVLKNHDYSIIARMDADDISHHTRFEKQYSFLSIHQDISCLGSWYEEIDGNGKHISYRKLPSSHEELFRRFRARAPFAHSSVMFRTSLIEKAGYYPTDTVRLEDIALWGKALKNGSKFANVPEYLLKFRIDENFLKRRSGFRYGFSFIVTRFKIGRSLNFPVYLYCLTIILGIMKMIPTFVLGIFYKVFRNY
jgi:glycosyltransferase involved in cell wall biosynthesis